MSDDYLWDRSGPEDPEIAAIEHALSGVDRDPPMPTAPSVVDAAPRTRTRRRAWAVASAVAALVLACVWWWTRSGGSDAWIEAEQATRVAIGSIGWVELEPGTRMRRLDGDVPHHFELAHGTIHAQVTAPPRMFVVETPSATAVDLGCRYDLTVDEDGSGRLAVIAGSVALEHGERECIVPQGAACEMRAGGVLGTAVRVDAPKVLRAAVDSLDFATLTAVQRSAALRTVLVQATAADAITLWHLVSRTDGAERRAVVERLTELVPPSPAVGTEAALAADREALQIWWREIRYADDARYSTQPPG